MKITVTQEDIDHGVPRSANECAIARAIKRASPDYRVKVSSHVSFWTPENDAPEFFVETPLVALDFIERFDTHASVEPFSFWLDLGDGAEPFEAPVAIPEAVLA